MQVWDEWQELTPDTVLTHFTFSIPPDGPPSFATPALSLRWLLRFQFTAGACASDITLCSTVPHVMFLVLPSWLRCCPKVPGILCSSPWCAVMPMNCV